MGFSEIKDRIKKIRVPSDSVFDLAMVCSKQIIRLGRGGTTWIRAIDNRIHFLGSVARDLIDNDGKTSFDIAQILYDQFWLYRFRRNLAAWNPDVYEHITDPPIPLVFTFMHDKDLSYYQPSNMMDYRKYVFLADTLADIENKGSGPNHESSRVDCQALLLMGHILLEAIKKG